MILAKDAVVWVRKETNDVIIREHEWGCPEDHAEPGFWIDPIGAAYTSWHKASDAQRIQLMLETVIDLAMQGIPVKTIVTAFCEIREFKELGNDSYPMYRAITSALIGRCLEPSTMSLEDLLASYSYSSS